MVPKDYDNFTFEYVVDDERHTVYPFDNYKNGDELDKAYNKFGPYVAEEMVESYLDAQRYNLEGDDVAIILEDLLGTAEVANYNYKVSVDKHAPNIIVQVSNISKNTSLNNLKKFLSKEYRLTSQIISSAVINIYIPFEGFKIKNYKG